MSKLTPWYPPEIKPVRVGYYSCSQCRGKLCHWWDGKIWHFDKETVMELGPWFKWRGLARKPK